MELPRPTFLFGVFVLVYLSSFVVFAVVRILTGISIQRIGYFSLRRLGFTPRAGCKIEIRGLGLNLHRPTFAQPTWISLVVTELAVTLDVRELQYKNKGSRGGWTGREERGDISLPGIMSPSNGDSWAEKEDVATPKTLQRSKTWESLMKSKERIKKLHMNIRWMRMVDVVATNSSLNVVGVGTLHVGSLTLAVDTRHKMVDRARFFSMRSDKKKEEDQAEWILTLRSVLLTTNGNEPLEILDHATLNVHGFLYSELNGLHDASVALKLGRVHVPYDSILRCLQKLRDRRAQTPTSKDSVNEDSEPVDIIPESSFAHGTIQEADKDSGLAQTVSDSKELAGSVLRGIKEVQFAVSFIGLTRKLEWARPHEKPVILNASMKEVGVDLHRLDPKSPAHRMYFPARDIAHEALAAALSISVGLDEGRGTADRILYVPMATTTVRTTLPSKTVELVTNVSAEERNQNILVANSVVTSPSVDLEPRHLSMLAAYVREKRQSPNTSRGDRNRLILSRLLPKTNIKFSMHEPVLRIALPPVETNAGPDDFDLIVWSISSVSLNVESFHSSVADINYSLSSTMRVQTNHLYYQTSSDNRFDLILSEAFDFKLQLQADPSVHVLATGHLQQCSVKMVRPEITDGLQQIATQLRLEVEPDRAKRPSLRPRHNFLKLMPSWLLHLALEISDFSVEIAGVDQDVSPDTRGVSVQLDSLVVDYQAHASSGIVRRRARRRSNSRSIVPDHEFPKTPVSPPGDHHQIGYEADERRLALYSRGLDVFLIETVDRVEVDPFVDMPRFDVAFSTLHDRHGHIFETKMDLRTLLVHWSLYRHYAVSVAGNVLRRAFMRSVGSESQPPEPQLQSSDTDTGLPLSPLTPDTPPGSLGPPSHPPAELFAIDFKAALVQVKMNMPSDPPMLLQIYSMEAGRKRWSTPYFSSRLIRVYVEMPRMKKVWARMVSLKAGRLDFRKSKRKLPSGASVEEKSIDVEAEAVRLAVPHEVAVNKITDNLINAAKAVQQLHHRWETGTNEYILEKKEEPPKIIPKMSVRCRTLLFDIEDGAFEWKLGMIYRAGLIEQEQRQARENAFDVKAKKIREEESRKDPNRFRGRSLFPRSRTGDPARVHRSRSADAAPGDRVDEDGLRGRPLRYDPEAGAHGLTGRAKRPVKDAKYKLDVHNAQSWRKRIDWYCAMSRKSMRDSRADFWGHDILPEDMDEGEDILQVPERPALLSTLISDFRFYVDKPTFPLREVPNFLHAVGKGMPRDMKYSLLVPMHVQVEMGEAKVSLRDYPLPLLHVPALQLGQSTRNRSLVLKSDFVVAEEYRGPQATRRIRVNIVPPDPSDPNDPNDGGFNIDVRRTIGPVKSFSDVKIDINSSLPARMTWGPAYQPCMQDMMMAMESFTKPQIDPSARVGFWDKLRLNFHSRIKVAWKGDGEMHLSLKGTRDPYSIVGPGAGFLMCWRNDVTCNINAEDDPKRFMTISSGEYVLAVPDYSAQLRDQARKTGVTAGPTGYSWDEPLRQGADFKKVAMKLSGKVEWTVGLVFERAIENGKRSFDFEPHYRVGLKHPSHARPDGHLPYDAFRGFRSTHIHLSIAIKAPVDRDWTSPNPAPSRSYNTVHLTPRFFTHFFAWWQLFGSPLSLPIRQGPLFPGREKNSRKFGRHLATIKYNLLLAPLFLSHIYRHKDVPDHASDKPVSATGVKVRFDSFMLDMHQRREEFNTQDRGRKTQTRTSGIKIHAAQLDLAAADLRAVSASLRSTPEFPQGRKSMSGTTDDGSRDGRDRAPDVSRFTIPDNDFSWIDMDDFVELGWATPALAAPETKILPLAYAPRLTYFRQTDIGGVIDGDPDRTSPFGQEPTHSCFMTTDDDPRKVQAQLIRDRLDELGQQMETHAETMAEAAASAKQAPHDAELGADAEALWRHTGVLEEKKSFLQNMLQQMMGQRLGTSDINGQANGNGKPANSSNQSASPQGDAMAMAIPPTTEFESDYKNRFVVHNVQLKWNNTLRNAILRYIHQVGQRRGFVYYLSRPAVKFILDIVEEQTRAKYKDKDKDKNPLKPSNPSTISPPNPGAGDSIREPSQDIEDRIRQFLQDGKNMAGEQQQQRRNAADAGVLPGISSLIEDLRCGIAAEFAPQSSYHIRLIAPQIQLQSDQNKKHVVLVAAKGMELKVLEVMDKDRLSDAVSGLVQRRFLVNMDSTQFFVTHQKWFLTQLVSMYAGGKYGTPLGSSWPPWVPMEVMFDFETDPFGFKRVVQKTSGTLRYDKYNTLRLKYNDGLSTADGEPAQHDAESRMDNLWVEFPQARAVCNSSQYYALYVIASDLLMYREPLEKTRSERLEKIMLASDFSDLTGAPEMVQKLQIRIRQLQTIQSHFTIYGLDLDKKALQDKDALDKDLATCEDELFFMMKAITTSQRKYDSASSEQVNALLKWSISARDIVWHLIKDTDEPLVKFQLRDVEYDRTDNADGSHINLARVGRISGLNLLPNATYPEIIAPYVQRNREDPAAKQDDGMIRVYWHDLEAIAGISIMGHFELNLFPMKIQLEREVGKQILEYIFPGIDKGPGAVKSESPLQKQHYLASPDEDVGVATKIPASDLDREGPMSSGTLESRLQPTLGSIPKDKGYGRKAWSVKSNEDGKPSSFRFFKSGKDGGRPMTKKVSNESIQVGPPTLRPGLQVRSMTMASAASSAPIGDNRSQQSSTNKKSRFALRNRSWQTDDSRSGAGNDPLDDLTTMMVRASNYTTYAYIRMPSVELCVSYKGKGDRNIEDVHDFVFRMPTIEWRNKTWSNLDLVLALKKAAIKALISHTGALVANKFQRHRPAAAQSRLREIANSSAMMQSASSNNTTNNSPFSPHGPGSHEGLHPVASDDSSSLYGTSLVDFSRSPPRSIRSMPPSSQPSQQSRDSSSASQHAPNSNLPGSASRSSSATSMRPGEDSISGGKQASVPSFYMMTTRATGESTKNSPRSRSATRPPPKDKSEPFSRPTTASGVQSKDVGGLAREAVVAETNRFAPPPTTPITRPATADPERRRRGLFTAIRDRIHGHTLGHENWADTSSAHGSTTNVNGRDTDVQPGAPSEKVENGTAPL